MASCFFVSDLHGNRERYLKLFRFIEKEKPAAVFMGGDILPSGLYAFTSNPDEPESFVNEFLLGNLSRLRDLMGRNYPPVFLIMGNDDAKVYEPLLLDADLQGLIRYAHERRLDFGRYQVFGYANVPPTPFSIKDWERYDVSRYIDPGCVPPEEGYFSVEVNKKLLVYETIQKDLNRLTGDMLLDHTILLMHTPPYKTLLDRAALDGKFYDHVPLDVHVGSIAVKNLIESRQPYLTLHGHIHESTAMTGAWKETIGRTIAMNAAHNGPELALIRFNPDNPGESSRELY